MKRWLTARAVKFSLVAGLLLAVAVPGALLSESADAGTAPPAKIPVDPATCTAIPVTGFGAAAGPLANGSGCRKFTVTEFGSHLIRAADANNGTLPTAVYSGGALICVINWCSLATGTYDVVVDAGADEPYSAPFRTTVTNLGGAGCKTVDAQGFSAVRLGTFTSPGQVDCLALPAPPGRYQVTLPPGDPATRPMVRLVQGQDTMICADVTSTSGCVVDVPVALRLIVVSQDPRPTGEYRLAVQRTSTANECAAMPTGTPGKPGQVTFPLSDDAFISCHTVSEGVLTLDRLGGDGTADLVVYDRAGLPICDSAPAAAYQVYGCKVAKGQTAVVRSAGGSGTFRLSQVGPLGANCRAVTSTAFGGPATAGATTGGGDVQCYRTADHSWIDAHGAVPAIRYLLDGKLYKCAALPCLVPGTEVLVTSEQPASYQLDTWAVGSVRSTPTDCAVVTDSAAYGFGPVGGTLSPGDRAWCVAVPVGVIDEYRLKITASGAKPASYVIRRDGAIVACEDLCWTESLPAGSHVLFAFVGDGGAFQVEGECLTLLCDHQHWNAGGSESPKIPVIAGTRTTVTIGGVALHQQDNLWVSRDGAKVAPIVIKSVDGSRTRYTAEIDATALTAGVYDLSATNTVNPSQVFTTPGRVVVSATSIVATRKPAIVGTAAVGAVVRVNPGAWSPAPRSYTYRWAANGAPISGATGSSYTIPASLRGKRLTVSVTAASADSVSAPVSSAALTVGYGVAPKATRKPKITGTAKVAKTVKASVGSWSPRATAYRYEWRVNGKLVATTAALKLKKTWATKKLTLTVIAKRTGHHDGRAVSVTVKIKK
ncbi:hypothetical protein OHA21_37195 [Actinoplanes sp. NBC_00393]|uniref:hypothetical protein n=1 Tax=Actinoplanes sp. NBC_00393 TaxID=2975953 RepID=UPI002E1DE61B